LTVARALGLSEAGNEAALSERLLEYLQPREMLLVLDNTEQLISLRRSGDGARTVGGKFAALPGARGRAVRLDGVECLAGHGLDPGRPGESQLPVSAEPAAHAAGTRPGNARAVSDQHGRHLPSVWGGAHGAGQLSRGLA